MMQNYEITAEQVKLNRERMTEKVIGEVVQCTRKGSRGNWLYSPAYEWAESQVRGSIRFVERDRYFSHQGEDGALQTNESFTAMARLMNTAERKGENVLAEYRKNQERRDNTPSETRRVNTIRAHLAADGYFASDGRDPIFEQNRRRW